MPISNPTRTPQLLHLLLDVNQAIGGFGTPLDGFPPSTEFDFVVDVSEASTVEVAACSEVHGLFGACLFGLAFEEGSESSFATLYW